MEKKLYRSRKNRVFGGVAGGLAEYFGLDPILMRVIFVVITLINGIGLILYVILWIVIPEIPFELAYKVNIEESPHTSEALGQNLSSFETKHEGKGRIVVGSILIILGALFFFERIIPSFSFEDFFPVVLIIIGIALIWNSLSK